MSEIKIGSKVKMNINDPYYHFFREEIFEVLDVIEGRYYDWIKIIYDGKATLFRADGFELVEEKGEDNMEYFDGIKVGDKVYSLLYGEGVICEIDLSLQYELSIEFSGRVEEYNFDGKYSESDAEQTLFWSKPEIIAPPRPKREVQHKLEHWDLADKDGELGEDFFESKEEAEKFRNDDNRRCFIYPAKVTVEWTVTE